MSQTHRDGAAERIRKELIEADFEIAFNLIDMAHLGFAQGDRCSAARALRDAIDVSLDIDRRLKLIESLDRQSFDPLVGELNRELALTQFQQNGEG